MSWWKLPKDPSDNLPDPSKSKGKKGKNYPNPLKKQKKITRELIDEFRKTTGDFPPPEDGSNRYSLEEERVFTDEEKELLPKTLEVVENTKYVTHSEIVYLYKHPSELKTDEEILEEFRQGEEFAKNLFNTKWKDGWRRGNEIKEYDPYLYIQILQGEKDLDIEYNRCKPFFNPDPDYPLKNFTDDD
jgi:hypothetical protein